MATIRAYSVCQSDGTDNAPTVYSYSVAPDVQNGDLLTPDGTPATDAYRTGLSPAYCHGGAATADADAIGYANTGGITPTLINGAASLTTGVPTDVTLTTAGGGNPLLPNCGRVVCSTTNITTGVLGAGLIVELDTTAAGVPQNVEIVTPGAGYGDTNVVGIDGFPGVELTLTV